MTDTDMTQALGLAREIAAFAPTVQRIAEHLAAQRKVAVTSGVCAYRGSGGAMCAVGCLIPDELYDPGMEGNSADFVLGNWPEVLEVIGIDNPRMPEVLEKFQEYHDASRYLPEEPNYPVRLDEFEGKPDAELAAAITADLNAIVTKLWEDA